MMPHQRFRAKPPVEHASTPEQHLELFRAYHDLKPEYTLLQYCVDHRIGLPDYEKMCRDLIAIEMEAKRLYQ